MRRRTFLGAGLATVAVGAAVSCVRRTSQSSWRFFSEEEARTVDAICEQLIPADQDPGARQAGVVNYIDIQLTRHFRRYQATYRKGLACVNATSRSRFARRFVELSSDQQVQVVNEIEESFPVFFELILVHTRQGFYGDPRHGGNRKMVSWKMVGLPFPPIRGRMHYDDQPKGA